MPFTRLYLADESMEEDEDSDLETTRVAEGASGQSVVNTPIEMMDSDVSQRRQLSTGENSHLENVNFSWLQDYFMSS